MYGGGGGLLFIRSRVYFPCMPYAEYNEGAGGRGALEDAIHRIRARPKNTGHIVQLFRAV